MSKIINRLILRYGVSIGAFVVALASLSSDLCRGEWYQPIEPDNLNELLDKSGVSRSELGTCYNDR